MESFKIDSAYLEDPVLLLRPLTLALTKSSAGYKFTLVRRDGESEEHDIQLGDLLLLGDLVRDLVESDQLEAVVLRGYSTATDLAMLHLPSKSFYAEGSGVGLGPLFVTLIPSDEEEREWDHGATTLWQTRYPSHIELA